MKVRIHCVLSFAIVYFAICAKVFALPPGITTVSPQSGAVGSQVTITGSNFSALPGGNIVFFGAVQANILSASATTLTVEVPAGSTYSPITVTTGGLSVISQFPFIVTFSSSGPIDATSLQVTTTLNPAPWTPRILCIADLDLDGKPDIACGNDNSSGLSFFRNTSISGGPLTATSFGAAVSLDMGVSGGYRRLKTGDIDGDGRPDVVTGDIINNTLSIFRNISTPGILTAASFAAPVSFAITRACQPTIADLDGDGKPEIIVASANNSYITIIKNNTTPGTIAAGSFATPIQFATEPGANVTAVADLDADGRLDIVLGNTGGTFDVIRNTSTGGTLSLAAPFTLPTPLGYAVNHVALGDLDSDNKPDIIIINYQASNNQVSIYKNNYTSGVFSAASFAPPFSFETDMSFTQMAEITDLDGDQKADFMVVGNGQPLIFRNVSTAGTLGTSSFVKIPSAGGNALGVAMGDLNADGVPEAIMSAGSTIQILRNGMTTISSFSPTAVRSNQYITIAGSNFDNLTENVKVILNNVEATVVNASLTSIVATVPASSIAFTGPVTVKVNTKTVSSTNNIKFSPPPIISSFSPSSGRPGDDIVLTGSNFHPTPANNIVTINATSAVVTNSSSTQLTFRIPLGALTGKVTLAIETDKATSNDNLVMIQNITGLGDDVPAPNDFAVYPNPAKAQVVINLKAFEANLPVDVAIIDYTGRLLINRQGTGGEQFSIDVNQLAGNLYLVRAVQNGRTLSRAFIKE